MHPKRATVSNRSFLTKASSLTWRTTKAILGLSAFPDTVETNDYERGLVLCRFTDLQHSARP
jgi:hypothetical protein